MSERDPALEPFEAVIGTWATEATHPGVDAVVPGSTRFEWLEGGHFVLVYSHNEHELFPDALGVIRAAERGGLVWEYFDSRGVRRTYDVAGERRLAHVAQRARLRPAHVRKTRAQDLRGPAPARRDPW
jgi:hypothetical protein